VCISTSMTFSYCIFFNNLCVSIIDTLNPAGVAATLIQCIIALNDLPRERVTVTTVLCIFQQQPRLNAYVCPWPTETHSPTATRSPVPTMTFTQSEAFAPTAALLPTDNIGATRSLDASSLPNFGDSQEFSESDGMRLSGALKLTDPIAHSGPFRTSSMFSSLKFAPTTSFGQTDVFESVKFVASESVRDSRGFGRTCSIASSQMVRESGRLLHSSSVSSTAVLRATSNSTESSRLGYANSQMLLESFEFGSSKSLVTNPIAHSSPLKVSAMMPPLTGYLRTASFGQTGGFEATMQRATADVAHSNNIDTSPDHSSSDVVQRSIAVVVSNDFGSTAVASESTVFRPSIGGDSLMFVTSAEFHSSASCHLASDSLQMSTPLTRSVAYSASLSLGQTNFVATGSLMTSKRIRESYGLIATVAVA
jgi:hypothetical protein